MGTKLRWTLVLLFCLSGLAGVGCSSHDDDDHHHHHDRWDDRNDRDGRPGPRGYRDRHDD